MVDEPPARLWLVFFGPGVGTPRWWDIFLDPGFRHVSAASYYPDVERWIYYDPGFEGTLIEVWRKDEFGARLGILLARSTIVLRVPSRWGRRMASRSWWCVGAIKSLLGVRTAAFTPKQFANFLLNSGAEVVDVDVPKRSDPAGA